MNAFMGILSLKWRSVWQKQSAYYLRMEISSVRSQKQIHLIAEKHSTIKCIPLQTFDKFKAGVTLFYFCDQNWYFSSFTF